MSVSYAAAAGTATAGVDFGAVAGTVSFPRRDDHAAPVAVPVLGDRIDEPNETLLREPERRPRGPPWRTARARARSLDDDAAGSHHLGRGGAGAGGPQHGHRHLHRDPGPDQRGHGDRELRHRERHGHRGQRLRGRRPAPLTFTPGASTQPVNVTVNADALVGGDGDVRGEPVRAQRGRPSPVARAPAGSWTRPRAATSTRTTGTDLLWRHDVSGENVLWFMNGATLLSGTFTTPADPHRRALEDGGHERLQRGRQAGHLVAAQRRRARTSSGS